LARAGSNAGGSNDFENSKARGMMPPVGFDRPSVSAWLSA
jgi:hypothetical protein